MGTINAYGQASSAFAMWIKCNQETATRNDLRADQVRLLRKAGMSLNEAHEQVFGKKADK